MGVFPRDEYDTKAKLVHFRSSIPAHEGPPIARRILREHGVEIYAREHRAEHQRRDGAKVTGTDCVVSSTL
jgi:hypothetical protein